MTVVMAKSSALQCDVMRKTAGRQGEFRGCGEPRSVGIQPIAGTLPGFWGLAASAGAATIA
jgi:hypothetical protein